MHILGLFGNNLANTCPIVGKIINKLFSMKETGRKLEYNFPKRKTTKKRSHNGTMHQFKNVKCLAAHLWTTSKR